MATARTIRLAADWQPAGDYEDIRYEIADGIAKITIDRPEVRNAFRPETLIEISDALERAREDTSVGVIVLTGEGPLAFCSGGDQNVRGDTGYMAGGASVGRFHVTDLHVQMRRLPARQHRRTKEGQGDLVPVPPVLGGAGARHGSREPRRPSRGARGGYCG